MSVLLDRMPLFYKLEPLATSKRIDLVILYSGSDIDRMISSKFSNTLKELKSTYSTLDMQSAMKCDMFIDF